MRVKKIYKHKKSFVEFSDLIAEYDFHSRVAPICDEEIYREVDDIIEYERNNGNSVLRIIVGKGNNSKFGPVIKPIVEYELLTLARSSKIKKFNLERIKDNKINSGAFIVEIY